MATQDVNELSRGSLQLTFDLLRKAEPELALKVRNEMTRTSASERERGSENIHTQTFYVTLELETIQDIIQALIDKTEAPSHPGNIGAQVMAKALLKEWLHLAQSFLGES